MSVLGNEDATEKQLVFLNVLMAKLAPAYRIEIPHTLNRADASTLIDYCRQYTALQEAFRAAKRVERMHKPMALLTDDEDVDSRNEC